MTVDYRAFEQAYGRETPPALKALYDSHTFLAAVPCRIALPRRPFVIEIQYYRSVAELVAEDIAYGRFAFAVDSDGHDLLVDLIAPDLPVLQREFGGIDGLDFTLVEFLAAASHRAAG